MADQSPWTKDSTFSLLPFATAAFAVGIFIADTVTHFEVAVGVLYVVVVLMAARFCQPRGIFLVFAGCIGLTVLSFFLSPPTGPEYTGIVNTFISILAICLTAFLVQRSQASEVALRKQANLLDLTHDTIFVRDMDDVITYWDRGATNLYGWTAKEVVGSVTTHQLLKTIFRTYQLDEIREELMRIGCWEGELTHTKADGTQVVVASRWSLQRDERQKPIAILEVNNDITERRRLRMKCEARNLLEQTHDAIIMWEFPPRSFSE